VGSLNFTQPPLSLHDGLVYVTAPYPQQLLIFAGGLSVFVGMILTNNLAAGFTSWLGIWFSAGCVGLDALLFYLPLSERLLPAMQSSGSTNSADVTMSGIFSFAGISCCLGAALLLTVAGIGAAQRSRNVSGFNFFRTADAAGGLRIVRVGTYDGVDRIRGAGR
jgi:hypothetical protein